MNRKTVLGVSERKDEIDERVKERGGERKRGRVDTHRMRGGQKRRGRVWCCPCLWAYFCLAADAELDIFGEKKAAQRKKHEAVSCAERQPQHRGIMGNHRRKLRDVHPIIRATRAVTVALAHTFLTYYELKVLRTNLNNNCRNKQMCDVSAWMKLPFSNTSWSLLGGAVCYYCQRESVLRRHAFQKSQIRSSQTHKDR